MKDKDHTTRHSSALTGGGRGGDGVGGISSPAESPLCNKTENIETCTADGPIIFVRLGRKHREDIN